MGRGGRRNKKKRQNPKWGQSAEGAVEDEAKVKDDGWDSNPFDKENEAFVKYYRDLVKLVPLAEWPKFRAKLEEKLPTAFRINASRKAAPAILSELQQLAAHVTKSTDAEPPTQMEWYPGGLGWQFTMSRIKFKRHTPYKHLHRWIVAHTTHGFLSRQEAVSMVPPLLLDVQPHHAVLDMCAAPGSKTAQLLEALHAQERAGVQATGCVVANDVSAARARTLCNNIMRVKSPGAVITQHNARNYPDTVLPTEEMLRLSTLELERVGEDGSVLREARIKAGLPVGGPGAAANGGGDASRSSRDLQSAEEAAKGLPRLEGAFDRVLCDVPCSGDGTIRKNLDAWTDWKPMNGPSLHKLQLSIAARGLARVKVGGMMVYSTCSFNPAENEAVVAALLRNHAGIVELVDVSDRLPKLKRRPGMYTWPVVDKDLNLLTRDDPGKAPVSLFPPSLDEAKAMHLERCIRLLPHDQNTGGFFVAVLRKLGPVNEASSRRRALVTHRYGEAVSVAAQRQRILRKSSSKTEGRGGGTKKASTAILVPLPKELRDKLVDTFGLRSDFPVHNLFAHKRNLSSIWLVTDTARRCLEVNRHFKLEQFGVKVFSLSKKGVPIIQVEGARHLARFMTKRLLHASLRDVIQLLDSKGAKGSGTDPPPLESRCLSPAFQQQIRDAGFGSVIVRLGQHDGASVGGGAGAETGAGAGGSGAGAGAGAGAPSATDIGASSSALSDAMADSAIVCAFVGDKIEPGAGASFFKLRVTLRRPQVATALAFLGLAGLVDESLLDKYGVSLNSNGEGKTSAQTPQHAQQTVKQRTAALVGPAERVSAQPRTAKRPRNS